MRAVVLRLVGLRLAAGFAVPVLVALERVEALLARAGLAFAVVERDAAERGLLALLRDPLLEMSSSQLPAITRCAASATASAISDPRRVAVDIMVLAAELALSAASIPASRIFLRAAGLALIAAAAAARPAASISLLIAALAILSTVLSFDLDFDVEDFGLVADLDFVFRLDFATANLPVFGRIH